jgi:hypothetical protein
MPGVFFLLPGERNRLLSAQDGMRVVNLAVGRVAWNCREIEALVGRRFV